jgi:hypothetical protein
VVWESNRCGLTIPAWLQGLQIEIAVVAATTSVEPTGVALGSARPAIYLESCTGSARRSLRELAHGD